MAEANKLVHNPNASPDEVKSVVARAYGVKGPSFMEMVGDLGAEQAFKKREGVYYDAQGRDQDDLKALVDGAQKIAHALAEAYRVAYSPAAKV